ncbi:hypothetical protein QTP88_019723 [Uroleucon formosanum]
MYFSIYVIIFEVCNFPNNVRVLDLRPSSLELEVRTHWWDTGNSKVITYHPYNLTILLFDLIRNLESIETTVLESKNENIVTY